MKIDWTFVGDIGKDRGDAAFVEACILLAHKLGLQIVAEGVETAGQLDFLRNLDCDLVQGNYLTRPVTRAAFLESLGTAASR